jgi:hypothetical protein
MAGKRGLRVDRGLAGSLGAKALISFIEQQMALAIT